MTFDEIHQRLSAKFSGLPALAPANKDAFLVVPAADIVEMSWRFVAPKKLQAARSR